MTTSYTLREAKARLSEILDLVSSGVPVEITRQGGKAGRFRIVATDSGYGQRAPGALKGRITIPAGFDNEDADILRDFEGP